MESRCLCPGMRQNIHVDQHLGQSCEKLRIGVKKAGKVIKSKKVYRKFLDFMAKLRYNIEKLSQLMQNFTDFFYWLNLQ